MTATHKLARALGWFSLGLGAAELLAPNALARALGTRRTGVIRLFGAREIATGALILARSRPRALPVWLRVAGDMLDLGALGGLMASSTNGRGARVATVAVAGVTAADIYCAAKLSSDLTKPLSMRRSITVRGSPEDLHTQWSQTGRLAEVMAHFAEVAEIGEGVTHWRVALPAGCVLEWDSEIMESRAGELLRWRSRDGGDISTEGSVHFAAAPADRGTEVTLAQSFQFSGSRTKTMLAHGFHKIPETLTAQALRRFKSLAETGECPTIECNATARSGAAANLF